MHDVLIIGAGNIAGGFDDDRPVDALPFSHAGAYRRHGGFRLAACVEPDQVRRTAFMQRWGVAQGYATTAEVVLEGKRFDVISICSPTAAHAADLETAIALKPRLIFCEKPVTSSAAQTAALTEKCNQAGIQLAVNYTRRWDASVRQMGKELRTGKWGAVRSAAISYNKGVLNNGSHMIDLLHLLLGSVDVIAAGPPVSDMWAEDPSVPGLLKVGAIPVTMNCGHASDYTIFELQLVTERGVILMQDGGMTWRMRHPVDNYHFKGYRSLAQEEVVPGGLPAAMLAAVEEIHAVLNAGATLSSSADNALAVQRVCETLYTLSLASQREKQT